MNDASMLLCLDLEPGSEALARHAAARAARCRQSVLVLHVRQRPDDGTAASAVRALANDLLGASVAHQALIAEGVAEDAIVRIAREHDVDLIVLGRRQRTTVEQIYVGSTTSAVIALARRPVLVVPVDAAR